jgi:hypothetical protein
MPLDVFVSKPNALTASQSAFWLRLRRMLEDRSLRPRSLGETDYPSTSPMEAVRCVVKECQGAIILGLRQVHVVEGREKPGTNKARDVRDAYLPTPWNQIECGMAYALQLPLLIVREAGVEDGVFGIGSTDRFVHEAKLNRQWLSSPRFLQPLNEWVSEVHQSRRRPDRP